MHLDTVNMVRSGSFKPPGPAARVPETLDLPAQSD